MNGANRIPVAVVGVGRMGRHHARIYSELDGSELVGVVDPDAERARAITAEFGGQAFASVEELLETRADLRAASVATPTEFHLATAEKLLPRGVACLIEKPLANSTQASRAIVDLARETGTPVQVGHTERFNPVVRAVRDLELSPRFVEAVRISPMSFRSIDVGVVFDLMIHDLDIVSMLADSPLEDVQASGVSVLSPYEDVANARLTFASGCVATLTASRLALKVERKLRVFSQDAYVSLDYADRAAVVLSAPENAEMLLGLRERIARGEDLSNLDYKELVKTRVIEPPDEEPLLAELSHFLEVVRDGVEPAVDAASGSAAVEAAERVVSALGGARWSDG